VANEFNHIFASVGENTITKIQEMATTFDCNYKPGETLFQAKSYPVSEQFSFTSVKCHQVEAIIKSMSPNKAPGIDKTPMRVIRGCLQAISHPVTSIINTSLLSVCFPNVWKIAEVKPILKDGDHEIANNNRPISLLPILSKACERVAHDQFMEYLTSKNRLSTKQSGNKKSHSTETSVIQTTDMILGAIDKKQLTAVVLLDMSKAFDSINHNMLLVKLQDVGASPSAIQWFRSYLTSCYQVVTIDRLQVVNGVPQGSILEPLLFSIYMNYLPSIPRYCSVQCYVDDTKLLLPFQPQDQSQVVTEINRDLARICNWCFNNQLLLNPDKSVAASRWPLRSITSSFRFLENTLLQ